MIEDPRLPDPMPQESSAEESEISYTPRPKWQLLLAWILVAVLLLGILGSYYWMMSGI